MRTKADIAIAGAGYVGLTSAACFCEIGHRVTLVDIDPERLRMLREGVCPIHEPGLPELLTRHLGKRLVLTDSLAEALTGARALFVCVGTPPQASGAPDLSAVRSLLSSFRKLSRPGGPILVLKSTVPPGTNRMAFEYLKGKTPVVSNPEFLREGTAIEDFFHPDRTVVGTTDEAAALTIAGLYDGIDAPLLVTGWEEAELIKYVTNTFLAMKISFANEVAALADAVSADAPEILTGLGLDNRVGPRFLTPGPGYGGSCLPKDTRALAWVARKAGVTLDLLPAAIRANQRQRQRLLDRLSDLLGGLANKHIAVWGLSFKAQTDDLRGAAAVELVPQLLERGATVAACDPAAIGGFERLFPAGKWPGLTLCPDPLQALCRADGLLVLTEWASFGAIPPATIAGFMAGNVVVDGRNLFDPAEAAAAGLVYKGLGRGRAVR